MGQSEAVPIDELWEERRFLLDVAHGMLGDPGVAESVVDEAYHRWYGLSHTRRRQVTVPRSWLAKTVGGTAWTASNGPAGARPATRHRTGHGRRRWRRRLGGSY